MELEKFILQFSTEDRNCCEKTAPKNAWAQAHQRALSLKNERNNRIWMFLCCILVLNAKRGHLCFQQCFCYKNKYVWGALCRFHTVLEPTNDWWLSLPSVGVLGVYDTFRTERVTLVRVKLNWISDFIRDFFLFSLNPKKSHSNGEEIMKKSMYNTKNWFKA